MFIKIGDSLDEAIETLQQYLSQVKAKPGTVTEVPGYLSFVVPDDEPTETITVTTRKPLLSRYLEFSIQCDGYVRATDIHKRDLRNIIFSLKTYRKIHPKEK
ncbi:MAG: hypothetical protein IJ721_10400 [Bacteroidales bacterium]|nr:hypothetical protein [Bacteroidales bacterium]